MAANLSRIERGHPALGRRMLLLGACGWGLTPHAASAGNRYALDPRYSTIEFSVRHLGLFASQGRFRRFVATLVIDAAHPERTSIAVDVDAASVDMAWQDAADMLRSPDFFDVRRHPEVKFTSTAVEAVGADRYRIGGVLEIRGVARPVTLNAVLTNRGPDAAAGGAEVADFVVTGGLRRSAFGMVADPAFISDHVNITIRARIALAAAPHAG